MRVVAVVGGFDGLMQRSKWQVRGTVSERSSSERREKIAGRREKGEERREKTEDRPEEAARGPQMRPPEGGPNLFYTMLPPVRPHLGTEGRGKRAEKREKRQERIYTFSLSLSLFTMAISASAQGVNLD